MGIVEAFDGCGEVDRLAAAVREWVTEGNPADNVLDTIESAIINGLVGSGKVLPEIATEAGRILRDRIRYAVFRPWDHYPLDEFGAKLALLTHGTEPYDGDWEAISDAFLDPIRDDLIRKGCPADVAGGWAEEIAGHSAHFAFEMAHSGGHQMGRA
jgi:hypothetical protein